MTALFATIAVSIAAPDKDAMTVSAAAAKTRLCWHCSV
jgi:hypothetical protein